MTIGGAVLVLVAITALTAGGSAGFWLARHVGIAHAVRVRLELAALAGHRAGDHAVRGARVLRAARREAEVQVHHAGVGDRDAGLAARAPGASRVYAAHFGSYNVTYGSIGGVIVLMTWFYISGFIFLMGGEMNAIIEHASPEGKGQRRPRAGRGAAARERAAERDAGGRRRQRGRGGAVEGRHPARGTGGASMKARAGIAALVAASGDRVARSSSACWC